MSSKKIIAIYEDLYKAIYDIFEYNGFESQLKPFNIQQDKIIIEAIFYDEMNNVENKDFSSWSNEEWLEHMKLPKVHYLSFLLKKNINLNKIYNICDVEEKKVKLLEAYKSITTNVCMFKKIESVKKILIDKNLESISLGQKKISVIKNFKNWKNPEYLANIVDLLYFKEFRENLISTIVENVDKIDIEFLKEYKDNAISGMVESIDKYFTIDNFEKICYFINNLELSGVVYCPEFIKNHVCDYVNGFIRNSEHIKKILINMENKTKDLPETNNKAIVKVLKMTVNVFINKSKTDTKTCAVDAIKKCISELNEKVKNNKTPLKFEENILNNSVLFEETTKKFTISNFKNKIFLLIFASIERAIELYHMNNEERIELYDKYGRDVFLDFFNKENENILIKDDLKCTENVLSFFKNGQVLDKIKELSKSVGDNIQKEELFQNFNLLKEKYVRRFKNMVNPSKTAVFSNTLNIISRDIEVYVSEILNNKSVYYKNKKQYVKKISDLLLEEINENRESVSVNVSNAFDKMFIDLEKNKPELIVKVEFLKTLIADHKEIYGTSKSCRIFTDLTNDLLYDPEQYKLLVLKVVNPEFIDNILTNSITVFGVNIEEEYKKKFKERIMEFVNELVDTAINPEDIKEFDQFVFLIAQGTDFVIPKLMGFFKSFESLDKKTIINKMQI